MMRFLYGPEVYWIILYILMTLIIRLSGAPVKNMDGTWIAMTYIVPLVLVPLSCLPFFFPDAIRNWSAPVRVLIAGIVGAHFVLSAALQAHSEQGPGVGTAYMLGIGLALFTSVGTCVFVAIKF